MKGIVISGRYEVIDQLGQGGLGLVYKVRHVVLDTILALKVLPHDLMANPEMVSRFYREARVMARLNHPNIVRVMDIDRDEGRNLHYLVMEYIQGRTLKQHIHEKGQLPLTEVLEIARQVATALDYAHRQSVIHRNIKPGNIMIEDRSSRVVVMDLDSIKELGVDDQTRTSMMIGTLKYASPEQLRYEPLDGSADVYSLGMVMYEMYTGKQFFGGLDEYAVVGKVLYDRSENVPTFDHPTPAGFANLITRSIAKDRAHRFHSMQDLLQGFRNLESDREDPATVILPPSRSEEVTSVEKSIRKLELEKEERQLVENARKQAQEAQASAERAGVAQRFAQEFSAARRVLDQGQSAEAQQDFTLASSSYREAQQQFARLAQEGKIGQAKEIAQTVRAKALEAREAVETIEAGPLKSDQYAEAEVLLARAEKAFVEQNYAYAQANFEKAVLHFQKLYNDAVVAQVASVRARAYELWGLTQHKEGSQKETAVKAIATGDQQLQRGNYSEARASYEEAASLLSTLHPSSRMSGEETLKVGLPAPTNLPSKGSRSVIIAVKERTRNFFSKLFSHRTRPPIAESRSRRGSPEVPGGIIDPVHFSVTAPTIVSPGASFILNVWAHLERQRETMLRLAEEAVHHREISVHSKGPVLLARGTQLSVRLKMEDLLIEEPEDLILWVGEIGNAAFFVRVPTEAREGPRHGSATVYANTLQIARIYFDIDIGRSASQVERLSVREERHRTAFASYASADRNEVLPRLQGMQKAAPHLEIFMDVLSLRSGQDWEKELHNVIPSQDVFYLFWSHSAKVSIWVEKEWRCALEKRGLDFIDPVPLVSPQEVPPPPELSSKHFNDWVLAFIHGSQSRQPQTE